MSMNFDLEAAKRGEPIEYQEAYGWVEIKFIGEWYGDYIVCSVPWSYKPETVLKDFVRMAKKRERRKYRVALIKHGGTITADSYPQEKDIEASEYGAFCKWLTDWQEYEIGASDEQK
jgi:hypothetical protein